jgi:drug/metabolite transporter (DMT)-like permease
MFLLFFVNALFALTYPFLAYLLTLATPLTIITIRMFISGIILILFQCFNDIKSLKIKNKDLFIFIITCILHMYVGFVMETFALQRLSGIQVSIFYLISPLVSAFIGYFFNKEVLNKTQIICIFLGIFIALFTIINFDLKNIYFSKKLFIPYLQLFICIFSTTFAWYKIKNFLDDGYSLITINGYAAIISSILSYITHYFYEGHFALNCIDYSSFFKVILLLIFVSNVFAYNFYFYLLKKYTITTIVLAEFLAPCFSALFFWMFYKTSPSFIDIFSFFCFVLIIYVFHKSYKK